MTGKHDEMRDEARLQRLFDRSAELPSGATLTRLAARAAEIPTRKRNRLGWFTALTGAAAGAAALAVVALAFDGGTSPLATGSSASSAGALSATQHPATNASEQSLVADEVDTTELAESIAENAPAEQLAAMDWAGDWDPAGTAVSLDLLHAPPNDAELEAWLSATAGLVDDGG